MLSVTLAAGGAVSETCRKSVVPVSDTIVLPSVCPTVNPGAGELSNAPISTAVPKKRVLHHGGVGTLTAVLAAGVPSTIMPQIVCRQKFGQMLLKESLATAVFDLDTLSPEDLAQALVTAVTSVPVRNAARRWQSIINAEDGVTRAADLVEQYWREISS